jgi:uncharacterized protein (UPF0332 family)
MAFDWGEFQKLANELRQRDDEAAKRTAVSRLYYSVYWKARQQLESEGFILSQRDGSHTQIRREYQKQGRTRKGVGLNGERLHDFRLQADYESEVKDVDEFVKDSFQAAKIVLSYLAQIQNN